MTPQLISHSASSSLSKAVRNQFTGKQQKYSEDLLRLTCRETEGATNIPSMAKSIQSSFRIDDRVSREEGFLRMICKD